MAETTLYECQLHAKTHEGAKRETFNDEFYAAVLNATDMHTSMRIYKEVKFNCHCPENYAALDAILATVKSKAPSTDSQ